VNGRSVWSAMSTITKTTLIKAAPGRI